MIKASINSKRVKPLLKVCVDIINHKLRLCILPGIGGIDTAGAVGFHYRVRGYRGAASTCGSDRINHIELIVGSAPHIPYVVLAAAKGSGGMELTILGVAEVKLLKAEGYVELL